MSCNRKRLERKKYLYCCQLQQVMIYYVKVKTILFLNGWFFLVKNK